MSRDKAVETPVETKAELLKLLTNPAYAISDEETRNRLLSLATNEPSPVNVARAFVEIAYANEDVLNAEYLALAAETAAMCDHWGWMEPGRGQGIAEVLKAKPGVTVRAAAKKTAKPPAPSSLHQRGGNRS